MLFCRRCATYSDKGTLQCPKCHADLSAFGQDSQTQLDAALRQPRHSKLARSVLWIGVGLYPVAMAIDIFMEEKGWNVVHTTPGPNGTHTEWPPLWIWYDFLTLSFFVMLIAFMVMMARWSRLVAGALTVLVLSA